MPRRKCQMKCGGGNDTLLNSIFIQFILLHRTLVYSALQKLLFLHHKSEITTNKSLRSESTLLLLSIVAHWVKLTTLNFTTPLCLYRTRLFHTINVFSHTKFHYKG